MYTQITAAERYPLARLRQHHVPLATIARVLGRHRSTLYREVRRNATHHDGGDRAELADSYARTRRTHSRRNQRFSPAEWAQVHAQLRDLWSPEQIAGRFRHERRLRISHETIYRHVWADKRAGGTLHTYLRGHPTIPSSAANGMATTTAAAASRGNDRSPTVPPLSRRESGSGIGKRTPSSVPTRAATVC